MFLILSYIIPSNKIAKIWKFNIVIISLCLLNNASIFLQFLLKTFLKAIYLFYWKMLRKLFISSFVIYVSLKGKKSKKYWKVQKLLWKWSAGRLVRRCVVASNEWFCWKSGFAVSQYLQSIYIGIWDEINKLQE